MNSPSKKKSFTDSALIWQQRADQVLAGQDLTFEQALEILRATDEQVLDLLSAAYRVRHEYFGNTVQLYFLMNAKSGLCPEDCHYCSQSKISSKEGVND